MHSYMHTPKCLSFDSCAPWGRVHFSLPSWSYRVRNPAKGVPQVWPKSAGFLTAILVLPLCPGGAWGPESSGHRIVGNVSLKTHGGGFCWCFAPSSSFHIPKDCFFSCSFWEMRLRNTLHCIREQEYEVTFPLPGI